MGVTDLYLGLGSNLGDRRANLNEALSRLDEALGCSYDAVSDFITTQPWGFESDEMFLNAVVRYCPEVPAEKTPEEFAGEILKKCKQIEREMGRDETPEFDDSGRRIYHSRTIDIDILLFGDCQIDTPDLKIPHPLMRQRDFVMEPLRSILRD